MDIPEGLLLSFGPGGTTHMGRPGCPLGVLQRRRLRGSAVAYAHEWGHHVQTLMKVPEPETPEENAVLEKQADCIAGAWAQHAAQAGNLSYPADLGDLNAVMAAVAPPDPGEIAIPVADRVAAFQLGYTSGLPGCNSFTPETPILAG